MLSEYGDVIAANDALQMILGRDVSRASALAVRVFREVFSIQDELQLRVLDEEGDQASDAPEEDICERCGKYGAGRRQLMLYPWWYALFGEYSRRQWFCTRCLWIMRVYAVVGFLLLAILVSGLMGVSIWLIM